MKMGSQKSPRVGVAFPVASRPSTTRVDRRLRLVASLSCLESVKMYGTCRIWQYFGW